MQLFWMQARLTPARLILGGLMLSTVMLDVCVRPALAQYGGLGPSASSPQSLQGRPRIEGPDQTKKPDVQPDALPGAAARADRVAPSQGTAIADPTTALFDAINRGDISSARDAIDRGADLDGPGILGMTPLDLSVDLGRNDITFLLLSLRNGDTKFARKTPAQTTAAGKEAAAHSAAAQGKATPAKPTTVKTAAHPPSTQAKPGVPVKSTLVAGDSGTPNPAAGFLGFGSGHTSTP
jgi:hypothetical protein